MQCRRDNWVGVVEEEVEVEVEEEQKEVLQLASHYNC